MLASLVLVALGAVLRAVEFRRELKLADQELSRLREELDSLKQQHDEAISSMQQSHAAETEERQQRIAALEKKRHADFHRPINYPDLKVP